MGSTGTTSTAIRFVITSLVWGSSFLFIKVAVEGLSPSQVALGRLLFGGITLALVMLVTRRHWPRERKYWLHISVVAVIFCVIPFLLFGYAGEQIPSGLSSIYNATTPITTMLIALAVLPQERLTTTRTIAIVVAAVGVVVVAAPWTFIGDAALAGSLLGQLACLGATTCYGIAAVYARRFISPFGYDATTVASSQIGVGALIMIVLTPAIGLQPVTLSWPVVLSTIALGVLGTGLAYVFYYGVLERWGATLASTVTYLTPIVGVALGVLVLHERLSWNEPLGAAIVIIGILVGQGALRWPRRRAAVVDDEAVSRRG